MDKTNINALVQSIERSLHLIHKKRFSIHCSCCLRTPLVELLGLCPHSCYTSLNFGLEMSAFGVAFRQLKSFSGNDVEGESISCVLMAREWPNLGGLAPRHTQRLPTYRDPFFPRPARKKKPTQYSLLQELPRKTFDR